MLIGLTGQIGAGKTTAAEILASLGAVIIDADSIGREVVERSPVVLRQLVKAFGQNILTKSGRLSRTRLAKVAFSDSSEKEKLDRLVHPHLLRTLRKRAAGLQQTHRIVVIDAALLLDWRMDEEVDFVIVIHARRDIRMNRLVKRGMSVDDARARERSQLPLSEYRRRADFVVLNEGNRIELNRRLKGILGNLLNR